MYIKRILLLILSFFLVAFLVPKISKAVDLQETLTSENSVVTKVLEGLEYFFTFRVENKIQVLEKQAEKRLLKAQNYADEGDNQNVQSQLQNYLQIKGKQDGLLGKIDDGGVLGAVEEGTIDQQKTMEEIKMRVDGDTKQEVVRVQEQVVNQVAKRVIDVNGAEGQTEFFQKVEHIWAPGTGPGGGEAGVVVVGGTMQFAPGTSAGGSSGADIKTNVVVTGGGENNVVEGGSGGGMAPGTTQDGTGGNTVEPGGVDTGNSPGDSDWVIDP